MYVIELFGVVVPFNVCVLSYNLHAVIGRGRFFLIALLLVLLVFLLAHHYHLRSVEPTGLRERWHTEVVKINEDDCINLFRLLRSSVIGHDVLLSNEPMWPN